MVILLVILKLKKYDKAEKRLDKAEKNGKIISKFNKGISSEGASCLQGIEGFFC